ncbi:phage baseplate assembly protein [Yersinia similis]|uniref:phage baseplate assembly protein n=1 Tax=Yersinia similis TaxID=367190 RepID=UPI00061BE147|nr:contractile injection system protein, VgrG/Pvc8 family [Yersinia similis]CNC00102.1 Mu P family protein [Yersinia similis]
MTHQIELYLDNRIYSGWKELSITRSIEEIAGQFTLGVTVNSGDSPLVLKAGTACKLEINGQRVVTGYVDTIEIDVEGKSRTTTVTGRDKTGDLVDCAAIHGKGQWRNVTLEQIARDLCQPFGVRVIWQVQLAAAATKFKVWQIEPGETVFDSLSRAARHRGVLLTSNANGDLVFTMASQVRAGSLILGMSKDDQSSCTPILAIKTHLSWMERFSLYRVKGAAAASGLWGETQTASQSTSVNVDVIDPEITRYRPTIIIADDNFTKAKGNARGSWEQQRSMAHATTATVTVQDWFNQRGQLWTPNQLVTVKATAAGLSDRDLLITTVTFDLTQDGGTVTELELMPREGFEEPAEPDAKTGSVSDGIWR